MKATILLADAAQVADNKLYVLGGGWSITGPGPVNFSVAIKLDIPWDVGHLEHTFRLELLDADGNRVRFSTPEGEADLIFIEGTFSTGRPEDLKPGTPLDGVLAFGFAGCPIPSGGRYEIRLWIDDETDEDWRVPFTTRPATEEMAA